MHFPMFDSDNHLIPNDRRADERRDDIRQRLVISYDGVVTELPADNGGLIIGRGQNCDIVVNGEFASRRHFDIEYEGDDFVLTDRSTNGTFVQSVEINGVHLKSTRTRLRGAGIISVGEPIDSANELMYFMVTGADAAANEQ